MLQAAIASLQVDDAVDWAQIAALYARLEEITGSPVVALNRAVAIAEAGAPEQALALVDELELAGLPVPALDACRAAAAPDRAAEARDAYERALELAQSEPERRFLARRLAEL